MARIVIMFITLLVCSQSHASPAGAIGKVFSKFFDDVPTTKPEWSIPKEKPDISIKSDFIPEQHHAKYIIREDPYEKSYIISWKKSVEENLITSTSNLCNRTEAREMGEKAIEEYEEIKNIIKEKAYISFIPRKLFIEALNQKIIPLLGIKKISFEIENNSLLAKDMKIKVISMCGYEVSYSVNLNKFNIQGGWIKSTLSLPVKI